MHKKNMLRHSVPYRKDIFLIGITCKKILLISIKNVRFPYV